MKAKNPPKVKFLSRPQKLKKLFGLLKESDMEFLSVVQWLGFFAGGCLYERYSACSLVESSIMKHRNKQESGSNVGKLEKRI